VSRYHEAMPPQRFIRPCAPARSKQPPEGKQWVHEIKWDGWRLQVHRTDGKVTLYSRPGNDITRRFPHVAAAISNLPGGDIVLDGELVAFNEEGQPDFHQLRRKRAPAVAWLFDIMVLNGTDIRAKPWKDEAIHLNEVWDDGAALLRAVGEQGMEGIVSKLRAAPYVSGDTDSWIKTKVPGWTESNRGRFRRRAGA